MENPAKRMKLSEDAGTEKAESSTGPFTTIHTDVFDHICQYLDGKDILNLFLVSKEWNRITGESSEALKKIKLQFRDEVHLRHSTYRYLCTPTSTAPLIEDNKSCLEILKSERKHQNVDFEFHNLFDPDQKLKLLQRFSLSLVSLKIQTGSKMISRHLPQDLSFPKLKSLEWNGPDSQKILSKALKDSPGLQKLSIKAAAKNPSLLTIIKRFKDLKELTLHGNKEKFFKVKSNEVAKFKLKSFSLKRNKYSETSLKTRQNFENFVLSMGETLISLGIDSFSIADLNLVHKLPNLKQLQIYHKRNNEMTEIIKPIQTIEKLEIHNTIYVPSQNFANFPNITFLKIQSVSKQDFNWIVCNLMGLQKLELRKLGGSLARKDVVEELYNKLKISKRQMNRNIEVVISKF